MAMTPFRVTRKRRPNTEDRRPLESDDPLENEDLENEHPLEKEDLKNKDTLENEDLENEDPLEKAILFILEGDSTALRSVTYCGHNPINFMKVVLKKKTKSQDVFIFDVFVF